MSKLPYHQMMSGRRGATLAPKYGFDSLTEFAESLSPEARVLDVGAGLSSLGRDVCRLRDDIQWTNADNQYGDPGKRYAARFQRVVETAPKNLHFEEANAVDLTAIFGTEQFDRVFSYWMLPHILRDDSGATATAVTAVENMLMVAKPSGSVAVGPINRPFFSRAALLGEAMEVQPSPDRLSRLEQAEEVVASHRRLYVGQKIMHFLDHPSADLELPSITQ